MITRDAAIGSGVFDGDAIAQQFVKGAVSLD